MGDRSTLRGNSRPVKSFCQEKLFTPIFVQTGQGEGSPFYRR
jgi:hypothetical protein